MLGETLVFTSTKEERWWWGLGRGEGEKMDRREKKEVEREGRENVQQGVLLQRKDG
jgi:hypothetical protein